MTAACHTANGDRAMCVEHNYRILIDQAPDGIMIADASGRLVDANPRACVLTGWTRDELCRMQVLDLFAPDQSALVADGLDRARANVHQTVERRVRRKDGSEVPVEISALRLSDGRLQGIFRDISERKQAEAALRQRERQLRTVVEAVNDLVFEFDAEYRYVSVFAADEAKLARPRTEIMGRTITEVLGHTVAEPFVQRLQRVLRTGTPESFEYSLAVIEGERHFQAKMKRLSGPPDTVCMGISDVTERVRAEAALHESERRLRSLAETVNLIVLGLDSDGRVDYVNPYFLELTGYSRDEVLGHPWIDRFVPTGRRPEVRGVLRELIEREFHPHHENPILTKSGEERMISWNNTVLRDAEGRAIGTLSIAEDITDRLRLEQQLVQAQKMEAIGQLAGGVAHDFNNLLTVIGGRVEFLLEDISPGDPRREDVEEIRAAARRAADLTRQLLLFSRRQVFQPTVIELTRAIRSTEKMLRRLIGEDIELATALEPALGLVKVDVGHLEQVLMNLAVNARDAMPQGGTLTIQTANVAFDEARVLAAFEIPAGPYVMVSVTDTGIGMTPEVQRRIFEPFFTTKERGHGTGLGLATVYAVVQQSGGAISVHSEPGVGTAFKIYLPRVGGAVDTAETPVAATDLEGTETILVVEDEPGVRDVARRALTRWGYAVIEAPDPESALKLITNRHVHLVLTDVVMPGMSGRQLVEKLEPLIPGLHVLYMSGYTDDAVIRRGVEVSETPFIQKPFRPDALVRRIRELLDG